MDWKNFDKKFIESMLIQIPNLEVDKVLKHKQMYVRDRNVLYIR